MNHIKHISIVFLLLLNNLFLKSQVEEYALPNECIVMLKQDAKVIDLVKAFPQFSVKDCLSKRMNIWLLKSTVSGRENILTLYKSQYIIKAQFNHQIERRLIPNDSYFNQQWDMFHPPTAGGKAGADIDADLAWGLNTNSIASTGDTLVIAVIEDKLDIFHEDMNWFVNHNEIDSNGIDDDANGFIDDYKGWNAFDNSGDVYDTGNPHGTHVAGIAAAIGNNGKGIAGVAFGMKVLPIAGSTTLESVAVKAYDYVIEMRKLYDATNGVKGAFIVATNSSFGVDGGLPINYPIWCAMYDSLGQVGILNACATANKNWDIDVMGDIPTACPSPFMISVTNTDINDNKNISAAFGKNSIDLGAPGSYIYSLFGNNSYGTLSGTSMATPHVSGSIGAMFASACQQFLLDYKSQPALLALKMKSFLLDAAEPIAALNHITVTGGRLNLYRALKNVQSYDCHLCGMNIMSSINPITCENNQDASIQIFPDTLQYVWANRTDTVASLTNLSAAEYDLTVTNRNGCSQSFSFFIDEATSLHFSTIYINPLTDSTNGNIIINAISGGGDSLLYALNGSAFQQTNIFNYSTSGEYTIRVKNESGCEIDTVLTLNAQGIHDNVSSSFYLYPNPADAWLFILDPNNEIKSFTIYNSLGEMIKQENTTSEKTQLPLNELNAGMFLIKVETKAGQVFMKKWIKE